MKEIPLLQIGKVKLSFAWYDLWIGAFIDRQNQKLYICPLPTILITISLKNDKNKNKKQT